MKIMIEITNCRGCHHVRHSGGFTVRGARDCCSHSDAYGIERVTPEAFKLEYPEYARDIDKHWLHHWIHRTVGKKFPNGAHLKMEVNINNQKGG